MRSAESELQWSLNTDVDPEPSVSPQTMIGLFEAALKQPGWIDDKVEDQFPSVGSRSASGIPLSGAGGGEGRGNQGKKRGPGKSLGVDLGQLGAERPKGS